MRYWNSSVYVQRQIDRILRLFRVFARAYENDVMIFSKFMKEHIRHLNEILAVFEKLNIAIKFSKICLEYSSVALLERKINSLDLSTFAKKLKVIIKLKFLVTLTKLKIYLELIDWLRNYISYYSQLSSSLQFRKTMML